MLACTRGLYSVAVRNTGPAPKLMSQIDSYTGMPNNSAVMGLLFCMLWLFYFYGANRNIFGIFCFDSSELPVITIYGFYIPIFIMYLKNQGKNLTFKSSIKPLLSIMASFFMIFAAFFAHGIIPFSKAAQQNKFSFPLLFYFIVFCAIMGVGMLFYKKSDKK
jgi:APA family basic amino acid/polyamine antiporter